MRNKYFEVNFRSENGGITGISPVDDAYGMNFIKEGGSFGELRSFTMKNFFADVDMAVVNYEKNGMSIQCSYRFEENRVVCDMRLQNTNSFPVYFDERDRLVLSANINDRYDSSFIWSWKSRSNFL